MPARHFTLTAVAPFRLDLTVWALRRRTDNLVDRWDGEIYRRVFVVVGAPVEVAVSQLRRGKTPRIEVAGARKRLQQRLKLHKSLDYHGVSRALRAWREFGGLIYFHMLLDGLVEKRTIAGEAG